MKLVLQLIQVSAVLALVALATYFAKVREVYEGRVVYEEKGLWKSDRFYTHKQLPVILQFIISLLMRCVGGAAALSFLVGEECIAEITQLHQVL